MEQRYDEEKESWEAFFHTGKVEDYLRYASCKTEKSVGERPYAGYYSGDRDYIETESYR